MEKKSKILLLIFTFIVGCSVFVIYYKYVHLGKITFFSDADTVPSAFDVITSLFKK